MKYTVATALVALAAPMVSAHYTFDQLLVNGETIGRPWQYVRRHDRGYMPTFQAEAATSNDFRCNQNADSGANTDVFTVSVGDNVGILQAFGAGGMQHPGPTQVYMSAAPGSVKQYDGSGDWFKVYQSTVCRNRGAEGFLNDNWCSWDENNISFDMPSVPNGEYLVRVEHIALHGAHDNNAEFYYACAQVKVEGSAATAVNGPTVKIPGVYSVGDAPHNFNIWNGRLTEYDQIPGPDVIEGGEVRGNAAGSTGETVVVPGNGSGPANPPVQPEPTPEPQPEPSPEPQPEPQPEPAPEPQPTPEPVPVPSPVETCSGARRLARRARRAARKARAAAAAARKVRCELEHDDLEIVC